MDALLVHGLRKACAGRGACIWPADILRRMRCLYMASRRSRDSLHILDRSRGSRKFSRIPGCLADVKDAAAPPLLFQKAGE
jgi:hypothetical protein